tara:strand:+ start:2310 stop:2678 length:369 start_codon:yes stop_codon:yes gene_type:complete
MKLRYVLGSLITALSFGFSANAVQAMTPSNEETVEIQVIDYSGKPPFKRRTVNLSIHDVAQLESVGEEAVDYVAVKEVIMRGKPPYRRVTTMMPVYDVAQLELLEQEKTAQKRGTRPPFKRH